MLAWETVSLMRGELYSEVPVVFENVRFNRATNIPKEGMNERGISILYIEVLTQNILLFYFENIQFCCRKC